MDVLRFPDPRLRVVSKPVVDLDVVRQALPEMTKLALLGAGLAAPQVGLPWRFVFIVDGAVARAVINPTIEWRSHEMQVRDEGCLSFPGIFIPVCRHESVGVQATDLQGKTFNVLVAGFAARVFQHEIDHLDGRLLIDHAGPVLRDIIRRKLRKEARRRPDPRSDPKSDPRRI